MLAGFANLVNIIDIKQAVPELFTENLMRDCGLFGRSVMKAQAASLPFTPPFAPLVSIINTKLPQVGELVLIRLINHFRHAFEMNDKVRRHFASMLSRSYLCVCSFFAIPAHLVNQAMAVLFKSLFFCSSAYGRLHRDCGWYHVRSGHLSGGEFTESQRNCFERFRAVLNWGNISQRVQHVVGVFGASPEGRV